MSKTNNQQVKQANRGKNTRTIQHTKEQEQEPKKTVTFKKSTMEISSDAWAQAFAGGGGWGSVNLTALAEKVSEVKVVSNVETTSYHKKEEDQETAETKEKEEVKVFITEQPIVIPEEEEKTQNEPDQNVQDIEKIVEAIVQVVEEAKPPAFDISKESMSWDALDLTSMIKPGTKKIVKSSAPAQNQRVKNDVRLQLTKDVDFSMTHFDKISKGFCNTKKTSCFMNVCLQSLFACPAFFNLLQVISNSNLADELGPSSTVLKLVHLQKMFDSKYQLSAPFNCKVANAESVFQSFLSMYNPDNEQQDAQDFLSLLLDMCHEELKPFYVSQKAQEGKDGESWSEVGLKETSVQENKTEILEPSIIRDIFGGVLRTELHVDGTKVVHTSYEPFYVLNLEIPRDVDNLQQCLDSYFQQKHIQDYQHNGKRTKASHKQLLDRLPNVLCLHLKRFIYNGKLIKMRDHVWFENVMQIKDHLVSKGLRVGIFNSKHSEKAMLAAQYRLFSVVEHVGEQANRGHYVCHTMDSDDSWRTFDDSKMKSRDLNRIIDSTQAYILFYELIQ